MKNITFISASAGSGKTYNLTKILTEWIKKNKCKGNEVLLTTFTKKAATEIKERVQSALLHEKLFDASNELQESYIGTIHSVGHKFISKYWYLLGISPELKEVSKTESNVFFANAIASIPTPEELAELTQLNYDFSFKKRKGNTTIDNHDKWKEDVLDIIKRSLTNNIDLDKDSRSLELSKSKINEIFPGKYEASEIKEVIDDVVTFTHNNPKGLKSKGYKETREEWDGIQSSFDSSIVNFSYLLKIINSTYSLKGISKNEEYWELLQDVLSKEITQFKLFNSSLIRYTELIFEIAKRSVVEYQNFKKENGLVDFTDMEIYFLSLLDKDIVREEIKRTIKLVMVDEFQDSNPIQLSIFIKLSEIVEKSYWVGDPKQAIYGFRGTDPVLIERVINEFTKTNDNSLDIMLLKMSWRSLPPIVELTNNIFSRRLLNQSTDVHFTNKDKLIGDNESSEFIEWKNNVKINPLSASETISLIPAKSEINDKEIENIHYWNFTKLNKKDKVIGVNKTEYNSLLSSKVAELIGEHKVTPSDICILVRSNDNVKDIAEEIKNKGIEVNASVDGLKDTVEFRIIKDIVSLFIDNKNALSISELEFLIGEENDIVKIIEDRLSFMLPILDKQSNEDFNYYEALKGWLKNSEILSLIIEIRKQSYNLSVSNTIIKIANQFNLFGKLMGYPNSSVRQSNIDRIIEISKEYEDYSLKLGLGSSLSGLFNYIDSDNELDNQSISTSKNAVNIMTYWKSKGLEWKYVILSDLNNNSLNDDKIIERQFFTTREVYTQGIDLITPLKHRQIEFSFWPFGSKKTLLDSAKAMVVNSPEYSTISLNSHNESSRLMYVGITRASDNLIFASNSLKDIHWLEDTIVDWEFATEYSNLSLDSTYNSVVDLFGTGINVRYQKIELGSFEYNISSSENSNNSYLNKTVPQVQNKNYKLSPSKAESLGSVKVELTETLHDKLKANNKDATEMGNALHQSLYLKDKSYFEENLSLNKVFDRFEIDENQFVENTIKFNIFLDETYKPIRQYPEYHLEQMIGKQLAKGEADLVLETDDSLILIDYKSYPGYDDVTDISSEFFAGKYSGQLTLYKQMLEAKFNKPVVKQLIYYVVLGKVVELNR